MLILSRKKNESIIIGDDIELMVTDISGDVVKLGISAPRHISVHRKEVYEAIKAENLLASKANTTQLAGLSQFLRSQKSRKRDTKP
jgi:carbon storage regulator